MAARYQEIASDLRERIDSGEYEAGAKLPGYRELQQRYGVGSDVIRRAVGLLERDGLVEIVRKAGITVRPQRARRRIPRGTLIMRDAARGYVFPAAKHPHEPWKSHGRPRRSYEAIPDDLASLLRVPAGSQVLRRRRVMGPSADDEPFDITDTWIHPTAVDEVPTVADASTGPGGYLDRLEEAGHGPIKWTERTRARMPTPEEARLLHMPKSGVPVLELVRIGHSARTSEPIEVTAVIIPADRGETWTTLGRAESAQWPVTPVTA
jgi:GntR family transcriptional regulator